MKRIPFVLLALLLSGVACSDDSEGPKKEGESDPVTLTLSDPNATEETKALYSNLWAIQSKGFMFGHHDDLMYGRTWYGTEGGSDTKAVCGDYPAVYSFDFAEHIDDRHASDPDAQALRLRCCREAYDRIGGAFDAVVNVQGDEPFIRASQLETLMRCFDDPGTDIATLVKPFTEADGLAALENPNSPKVVLDAQSRAIYFSRSVIPYLRGVPREEWLARHTFYKHIGMYAFRRETLYKVTALPQSALERAESLEQLRWLENGFRIRAGISDVETIGIDTPEDLAKAEEFLKLKTKN